MEAFPDIQSLNELDVEKTPDLAGFVSSERLHRYRIESGSRLFQVTLKGVMAIDGIVGFFTDITEVARMDLEIHYDAARDCLSVGRNQ